MGRTKKSDSAADTKALDAKSRAIEKAKPSREKAQKSYREVSSGEESEHEAEILDPKDRPFSDEEDPLLSEESDGSEWGGESSGSEYGKKKKKASPVKAAKGKGRGRPGRKSASASPGKRGRGRPSAKNGASSKKTPAKKRGRDDSESESEAESSGSEYGKKKVVTPAPSKKRGAPARASPKKKAAAVASPASDSRSRRGRNSTGKSYKEMSEDDIEEVSEEEKKPKRAKLEPKEKAAPKPKPAPKDKESEEEEDEEMSAEEEEENSEGSDDDKKKPKEKKVVEKKEVQKNGNSAKPKPKEKDEDDEEEDKDSEDEEEDEKSEDNHAKKDDKKDKKKDVVAEDKSDEEEDEKEVNSDSAEDTGKKEKNGGLKNKTETDYSKIVFESDKKSPKGEPSNYKIACWNIGGIKSWLKKNGTEYLKKENPDVMCFNEIKCNEKTKPTELAKIEGYPHTYWSYNSENSGHSGVAILSKTEAKSVQYGFPEDEESTEQKSKNNFNKEGRLITVEFENFYLINAYVPNSGRAEKSDKFPKGYPPKIANGERLKWDEIFKDYIKDLEKKKPVIVTGDLNVSHQEIDLANPKTNSTTAGFTKEEREGMTQLLEEATLIDSFRTLYPDDKGAYSFWSYMHNSREKNVGWRLDYFLVSEKLRDSLCDSVMRKDVLGSDHCPIVLFLNN